MSLTLRVAPFAVLTAALLAVPLDCGRRAAPPAPKRQPAKVVLPAWAPADPSPEFLRAAKVLKPVPEEVQTYDPLYVPAWELFGSLTGCADRHLREGHPEAVGRAAGLRARAGGASEGADGRA